MVRFYFISILIFINFISCDSLDEVYPSQLELPIINLTIDEYYLFSPDSGLFVIGDNGITNWTGFTANYFTKWEHPAKVSFHFGNDFVSNDPIGFRVKANSGRLRPNKTLGLYWREEYGNKRLEEMYSIFPGNRIGRYKRLKLDAGFEISHNIIVESIVKDMVDIEVASMRPVNLYINEDYWGLYNLRETISPHHFEYHYGVSDDSVNILQRSPASPGVDDGTRENWIKDVYSLSKRLDFRKDESLQTIGNYLDLSSTIDYFAVQTYIYNWDWPLNNMKWWNDPSSEHHKKWRFIFSDIDKSFNLEYTQHLWLGNFYVHNKPPRVDYEPGFVIFDKLMENKSFRILFFKRYLEIIDEIFAQERVERIVNNQISQLKNDYKFHYKKWGEVNPIKWELKLREIATFNKERQEWLRPKIQNWYDIELNTNE